MSDSCKYPAWRFRAAIGALAINGNLLIISKVVSTDQSLVKFLDRRKRVGRNELRGSAEAGRLKTRASHSANMKRKSAGARALWAETESLRDSGSGRAPLTCWYSAGKRRRARTLGRTEAEKRKRNGPTYLLVKRGKRRRARTLDRNEDCAEKRKRNARKSPAGTARGSASARASRPRETVRKSGNARAQLTGWYSAGKRRRARIWGRERKHAEERKRNARAHLLVQRGEAQARARAHVLVQHAHDDDRQ